MPIDVEVAKCDLYEESSWLGVLFYLNVHCASAYPFCVRSAPRGALAHYR